MSYNTIGLHITLHRRISRMYQFCGSINRLARKAAHTHALAEMLPLAACVRRLVTNKVDFICIGEEGEDPNRVQGDPVRTPSDMRPLLAIIVQLDMLAMFT